MNTNAPPFHNTKLRQAFAYAVQRDKMIQEAYLPLTPAFSLLLPFYKQSKQTFFPEYNPEKARQLFQEALQELRLNKEDLPTFTIICLEKGILEYTAQILKKQIKECLNIDCILKPIPWNMVFHKMTKGFFQIGLMHWNSWIDDPTYTLSIFKSSKQDLNFAKWEHPEYLNLVTLSDQQINPFNRSSYLLKAEEVLSRETPILPLFYQSYQALIRQDLQLFFKSPCGPFNVAKSFYKMEL